MGDAAIAALTIFAAGFIFGISFRFLWALVLGETVKIGGNQDGNRNI